MESRDKKITSLLNQGVINRFKSCGYSDRAIYRASITLATLCVFTNCGDKDKDKDKDKDEGGEKAKEALKNDLIEKLKNMNIPEGDAKAYAEQVTKGGIELTKDNIERLAQLIKSRAKDGKLDEKALNEIKNELKKKAKPNDSKTQNDSLVTDAEIDDVLNKFKIEPDSEKTTIKTKLKEIKDLKKADIEKEINKYLTANNFVKGQDEVWKKNEEPKDPGINIEALEEQLKDVNEMTTEQLGQKYKDKSFKSLKEITDANKKKEVTTLCNEIKSSLKSCELTVIQAIVESFCKGEYQDSAKNYYQKVVNKGIGDMTVVQIKLNGTILGQKLTDGVIDFTKKMVTFKVKGKDTNISFDDYGVDIKKGSNILFGYQELVKSAKKDNPPVLVLEKDVWMMVLDDIKFGDKDPYDFGNINGSLGKMIKIDDSSEKTLAEVLKAIVDVGISGKITGDQVISKYKYKDVLIAIITDIFNTNLPELLENTKDYNKAMTLKNDTELGNTLVNGVKECFKINNVTITIGNDKKATVALKDPYDGPLSKSVAAFKAVIDSRLSEAGKNIGEIFESAVSEKGGDDSDGTGVKVFSLDKVADIKTEYDSLIGPLKCLEDKSSDAASADFFKVASAKVAKLQVAMNAFKALKETTKMVYVKDDDKTGDNNEDKDDLSTAVGNAARFIINGNLGSVTAAIKGKDNGGGVGKDGGNIGAAYNTADSILLSIKTACDAPGTDSAHQKSFYNATRECFNAFIGKLKALHKAYAALDNAGTDTNDIYDQFVADMKEIMGNTNVATGVPVFFSADCKLGRYIFAGKDNSADALTGWKNFAKWFVPIMMPKGTSFRDSGVPNTQKFATDTSCCYLCANNAGLGVARQGLGILKTEFNAFSNDEFKKIVIYYSLQNVKPLAANGSPGGYVGKITNTKFKQADILIVSANKGQATDLSVVLGALGDPNGEKLKSVITTNANNTTNSTHLFKDALSGLND